MSKYGYMNKKNKKIAIIPARLESSRLPQKLLIPIAGKTVLQRCFENISKNSLFDKIYIATDSEKIYNHALSIKATPIMTPPCSNGTERIIEAISKLPDIDRSDIIVNIQGDHPTILPSTIKEIIALLEKEPTSNVATAASKIKNNKDALSPHIVKVTFDILKNALYFSRSPIPFSKDLDKACFYQHIGIYAYRREFLGHIKEMEPSTIEKTEDLEQLKILQNGHRIKVAVVKEDPINIDVKEDLKKFEKILCR